METVTEVPPWAWEEIDALHLGFLPTDFLVVVPPKPEPEPEFANIGNTPLPLTVTNDLDFWWLPTMSTPLPTLPT